MPSIQLSPGRVFFAFILTMVCAQPVVNLEKDRRMIVNLQHEPSHAVCIGRVLIDVPTRLETSYGMTYFAGWKIATNVESMEAFRTKLQQRVDSLSAEKNAYGDRNLELAKNVGGGWDGKILQFARESLKVVDNGIVSGEDIVKIEGHVHSGGVSFDISGGVSHEKDFEELARLITKLKVRNKDQIPLESGFCIDRGIILGRENPTLRESVTLFAGVSNSNDLAVVIDSVAGTKAADTLLDRMARSSTRQAYASSFKNLRIGPREIGGHKGEEVLSRVTEDDGRGNHDFVWESIPVKEDIYRPQLTIELSTGHGKSTELQQTPFTDGDAIALWDRITLSLRNGSLD